MCRWYLLLSLAGFGCAGSEPEPISASACVPPDRSVGERCVAPGVQDNGCPAGTSALEDGSCQPAGIPPELCAEGFAHDGDAGCEPILPAEPCPLGQMAVPGESRCRAVMSCGAGTWGDIPVDGASVYVDAAYLGGGSDGSLQKPWTTISEAIATAPPGALIAVAAGNYGEDVLITKPVRLWGVCPEKVELAGAGAELASLVILPGAGGSELHGFAVTGNAVGIAVSGAENVVVEQAWVHDAIGRGLAVEDVLGPTSVTLRASLLEQNRELGVFVLASQATLERVVVRGTLPRLSDQALGRGINVQANTAGAPARTHIQGSVVEDNREVGVRIAGSEATLEGVIVRGTLPRATDQLAGQGIEIGRSMASATPSTALVRSSLVEQNHAMGVVVKGSEATFEGILVRLTAPRASDDGLGRGLSIEDAARAYVASSLVEQNHELGACVLGAQATFEGVLVRDTLPRMRDQVRGEGIVLSIDPVTFAPATGIIRSSVVAQNHEMGILVMAADVTLEAVVAQDTLPVAGTFGDGVAVASASNRGMTFRASALVTASRITQNRRAGVANFGADVTLADSALFRNVFDLNAETLPGFPYTFEDLGGNGCGDLASSACVARSSGLVPPESPASP